MIAGAINNLFIPATITPGMGVKVRFRGLCIIIMAMCMLACAMHAVSGYASTFAASGYGFSGFCFDPGLATWGWAMPMGGWGWAWPIF